MSKKTKLESYKPIFGKIVSGLSFPELIDYGDDKFFVPANGRVDNIDKSMLVFPLPKGIKFIENQE